MWSEAARQRRVVEDGVMVDGGTLYTINMPDQSSKVQECLGCASIVCGCASSLTKACEDSLLWGVAAVLAAGNGAACNQARRPSAPHTECAGEAGILRPPAQVMMGRALPHWTVPTRAASLTD